MNNFKPLISIGPRVRKSPFYDATVDAGVNSFTIYNHTFMPTSFGDPVAEYWSMVEDVTLWDVTCEKQIEVTGPDAARFVQWLTCRDISTLQVNRCRYVLFTDNEGGLVNDAVLLKLAEDHFWLSPGDGDFLLWAQGIATMSDMDITVIEPDASPLQLQGPKAPAVAHALFGDVALEMGYFHMLQTELEGIPVVISRTGWSGELGYEIYLRDGSRGTELWNMIMAAGAPYGIKPACPSLIRTVEGGILSYASDIQRRDNPFTIGMGRLVSLDTDVEYIGKAALQAIAAKGPERLLVGLEIEGDPITGNEDFWPVTQGETSIGHITRAVYSPRLKRNLGLANLPADAAMEGTVVHVQTPAGRRSATVVPYPWITSETVIPPQ